MKKQSFNIYFALMNLGILLLAVFLFPTYQNLPGGLFSQILSIALYLALFLFVELNLIQRNLKFLSGSFFFIFCLYYLLDAFALFRGSFHFIDLFHIAFLGGDLITTLKEVGISPLIGSGLLLIPLLVMGSGWWIYKKTFAKALPHQTYFRLGSLIALVLILVSFWGEQAFYKNDDSFYLRSSRLPLYGSFFSSHWERFSFSASPSEQDLQNIVASSLPAKNPQNILLVILEGVPAGAITAETAPALYQLLQESHQPANVMTEAIATHLALNSLLFNRPGYSFENDLKAFSEVQSAALPFEIYKKNNYEILMAISTDFRMKSDEARALGKKGTVDHYYRGFQENYVGRNITDNKTADQAVQWLDQKNRTRPFLMTLQFDCTHWPYEFDEDKIVFKPYLTTDRLDKFDSPERTLEVTNRYKNSLRQLDSNMAKVLTALSKAGLKDKTAIVVISDHGENFSQGQVTHLNLSENSKKITALIHLPGQDLPEASGFITHRDIWPTLLDFTGIKFAQGVKPFSGQSLLNPQKNRTTLLTVNGNLRLAELSYLDKVIHFRLQVSGQNLFLAPYLMTDKAGTPLKGWPEQLENIDWKKDVTDSLD